MGFSIATMVYRQNPQQFIFFVCAENAPNGPAVAPTWVQMRDEWVTTLASPSSSLLGITFSKRGQRWKPHLDPHPHDRNCEWTRVKSFQTNPESNLIRYDPRCKLPVCLVLPVQSFPSVFFTQKRLPKIRSPINGSPLPSSRGEAMSLPLTSPASDPSHSGERPMVGRNLELWFNVGKPW